LTGKEVYELEIEYIGYTDISGKKPIEDFSKKELAYAQNHLRLLSGLYGVLKPLDLIEPYRLEMGTKLETKKGKNLYEFWGDDISKKIMKDLKSKTIINLASNEYFNSVKILKEKTNVVSPAFKDLSKGKYKIISFYAKKARGLMASWILRNKIQKYHKICAKEEENTIITGDFEISKGFQM
jgi:hypothetical protein